MGGKLFNLPRMARAEYLARERAVRDYLDRKLDGGYRIPRYHDAKADFGDMDIILPTRVDWDVLRQEIVRDLGIAQTKSVGRVFSTVFDGLQTDFFAVPERYVDSTYTFMSFNDLGHLIGRMCRRFNLKWGEHGLSYVFRRPSSEHYVADLPVTQDFARVCTFLGLDHAAWATGFADLPCMFEWVVASPWFSVAPYLDTERTKERATIVRFVEYLRDRRIASRPAFADKTSYIATIAAAFPEARLEDQLAAERELEARVVAMAAKFSGKLVMRLRPELSGQALGEMIVAFKKSFSDFEAFVLGASPEEIERRIREFTVPPK